MKIILSVALLFATVSTAGAQGLSATASAAAPSAAASEIKVLRQQLSALEGRVHALEKKADDVKNDGDDASKEKALTKRLDAIESAQKKLESEQETAQQSGSSHAKAPFIIYDKNDHPIFRVEMTDKGAVRLVVGNPIGVRTVIYANDQTNETAIQLKRSTDSKRPNVVLFSNDESSSVIVFSSETKQNIEMATKPDNSSGITIAGQASPLAYFASDRIWPF